MRLPFRMGTLCRGSPTITVYAASEAALLSFARTWTSALQDRKICVNVLSPGEIAMAALFLTSRDSSFVTGIELGVAEAWGKVERRRVWAQTGYSHRSSLRLQEALDGKPGW